LSWQEKVYSHSTTVLKSVKQSLKHACLVLFSSFCAIGAALNGGVHSHQVLAQSSSLLSNVIDSYHWVNSLYDGTINCFSTLAQSCLASNETFHYKEALQQSDRIEFIVAMKHGTNYDGDISLQRQILPLVPTHVSDPISSLKFIGKSKSEGAGFAPTTFQAFELTVALTSIDDFQLIVSVFLNLDSEGAQAIPNKPSQLIVKLVSIMISEGG
jgi:hypothetical protein